jgi:hypothetical protein
MTLLTYTAASPAPPSCPSETTLTQNTLVSTRVPRFTRALESLCVCVAAFATDDAVLNFPRYVCSPLSAHPASATACAVEGFTSR